jgi:uncharacterized protein
MYIKLKLGAFWGLLSLIIPSHAQAQVSFTGAMLTQNFDSLLQTGTGNVWTDNSTLLGWYANQTTYSASDGSSNTASLYSFGTTANSDRALGGLTRGGTGPTTITFALQLQNNTGSAIDLSQLTVSYTGEQWAKRNNAAQSITVDYLLAGAISTNQLAAGGYTTQPTLDFTSPVVSGGNGALNGNVAPNRTNKSNALASSPQIWSSGDYLWVRWTQTSVSSNDQGLAVDNLSVSVIPEPGTLAFLCLGGVGMTVRRRKKTVALLPPTPTPTHLE